MNKGEVRIRLTFNGHQAIALIADNPTSRSLLAQLPLTISFEDYASSEKITDTPKKLSKESAPGGYAPDAGDITCFAPWGNIAIFYKSRSYASGLIYIGTIESGLSEFSRQKSKFDVTIERIE